MAQAKRSLKASQEGINRANKAVLTFATKIELAAEVEICRATVQKFFAGKPVGRENFHKICQTLNLPWQEIAELPEYIAPEPQKKDTDNGLNNIDSLVQEVREKGRVNIYKSCGMIRVLDMSQPIELNDIYTNVNILQTISGRRRLEVADLLKMKISTSDEFERPSLSTIEQERLQGLEAVKNYSKLIVLGKPGAGKTTFLKCIALQCSLGELQADKVPIFIRLKVFAETEQHPSLLEYIKRQFGNYGFTDIIVAEQLLNHGKVLVLLDGLDEVRETDVYRVLQEVHNFTTQFHNNHFVITCRIATREYTLEEFTEVEVADFDDEQITIFANKWFAAKDPDKSNKFLNKLKANSPVREIAICPLLLTLLCLMFEEAADFPSNRSVLYKEAINVLLKKWDAKRNIERDQVYKNLSVFHKEDLLSRIALMTFERGEYFFIQKEIEQYLADYIHNLPSISTELEALQLDSEAVLKSIEAQHGLLVERARGIYSFSHLTFQEYFTAREIVSNSNPQVLETALKQLVSRVTETRWHEVILLSVGMLRNADYMLQLMKQQIDRLIAQDEQLQAFLTWVSQKSRSVTTSYKPEVVRAFYFELDFARKLKQVASSLDLTRKLERAFTCELDCTLALDLSLDRALALNRVLNYNLNPTRAINNVLARAIAHAHNIDFKLERSLQQLQEQLPDSAKNGKGFEIWWKANNQAWTEQLRSLTIEERNLGHTWEFSKQQMDALKQYYNANQLLIDCLNSNCYITRKVRQEIENTLLLPIAAEEMSKCSNEEKIAPSRRSSSGLLPI